MKRLNTIFALFFAASLILSCGEDRTYQFLELTEECQWIYAQMKEHYLWNDSIKQPARSKFFSKSADFYKSLLQKEDKTSFYGDSATDTSYGLSFLLMRDPLGIQPSRSYALVLYVEPQSPAHRAGVTRGMWIASVGGKEPSSSNQAMLVNGKATTLCIKSIIFDEEQQKDVWSAADTLSMDIAEYNSPVAVPVDTIYNRGARKAGYIVLNNFNEGEAASSLYAAVSQMKAEQVNDIVLDLRYNSGGSLAEAAECASILADDANAGKVFCSTRSNALLSHTAEYLFEPAALLDATSRIYILVSSRTMATAQLFVASLQQTMEARQITVIGETAGVQPYITQELVSPYGFAISPVVATLYTADGNILSSNSVVIDNRLDELENITHIYPLGDIRETLLNKALSVVEE